MTTILLIDDDKDVRSAIARVLQREGFEVYTAENASAGIAQLEATNIDLLITDIIMPGIDGVQAIKQIRASNPDIRIIAISGGGNFGAEAYQPNAITTTAYLQAAIEAGADWIMTKPFDSKELVDCAHRVIRGETV